MTQNKIKTLQWFGLLFSLFVLSNYTQSKTAINGLGYEIWLGTHASPKSAIKNRSSWEQTAKLVEGLNIHKSPVKLANKKINREETLNSKDFKSFINIFEIGSANGIIEAGRTGWKCDAFPDRSDLEDYLEEKFKTIDAGGYTVKGIMFFDNFIGSNSKASKGVVYSWTEYEVQRMRDWLDVNRPNVILYWNARNFYKTSKNWCANDLVDGIFLEGNPSKWYENKGKRQELLKWLWSNDKTKHKQLVFQVPVSSIKETKSGPTAFQQVRLWVKWLGVDFMGLDFLRSNQVVIMPVTYNPAFKFYPETRKSGKIYANTMTGITLSLLEQKNLFQGVIGTPTIEAIESNKRNIDK
jgi:hypothetical protein